ncbi:MAG: CDP-alcohol phosphatidyltransferase family protein [Hyphomicrobiales bacterium]
MDGSFDCDHHQQSSATTANGSFLKMTIPNLISIFRLLIVPLIVWLLSIQEFSIAFWLFLAAGISDAVDGFIAKKFNQTSDLGAHLDPIADKVMLVAVILTLGIQGLLPIWLVILAISRDILIVGAVILTWIINEPIPMKPLLVSKANTVAQIALVCVVMGAMAFELSLGASLNILIALVAGLTVISTIAYILGWIAHIGDVEKT